MTNLKRRPCWDTFPNHDGSDSERSLPFAQIRKPFIPINQGYGGRIIPLDVNGVFFHRSYNLFHPFIDGITLLNVIITYNPFIDVTSITHL